MNEMSRQITKLFTLFSVCLIFGAEICPSPLRAQDIKIKRRIYLGGGIGMSLVTKNRLGKCVSGFGPSYGGVLGAHLSDKSSLQLEYIVNHPNDEEPKITDILVTKRIQNGNEYYKFTTVRSPKRFQTRLLLISYQRSIFKELFYRIGVGIGSNYYTFYRESKDAVLEAGITMDSGYALGFAGGYERHISDRLTLDLEASVRWSSGEDTSNSRFVFGLGTVFKWDF